MKKRRIPPMLVDIIQATLASVDGARFESCRACPSCGGDVAGYDWKTRQFAVVMEREQKKIITIHVRRFRCRQCNSICYADQPFYPETRVGSPIVDLCLTLGETLHFPGISSTLADMGVIVDRWSVRNYLKKYNRPIPAVDMFGIRIPASLFALSSLAAETREGTPIDAERMLEACGYPSRGVAPAGKPLMDTGNEPYRPDHRP